MTKQRHVVKVHPQMLWHSQTKNENIDHYSLVCTGAIVHSLRIPNTEGIQRIIEKYEQGLPPATY
jgi:hypothetical protein